MDKEAKEEEIGSDRQWWTPNPDYDGNNVALREVLYQLDKFPIFYEVRFLSLLPLYTKHCKYLFTYNYRIFFFQGKRCCVILMLTIRVTSRHLQVIRLLEKAKFGY